MERHEIYVDGAKVASVVVESSISLLAYVAQIRNVIEGPNSILLSDEEHAVIESRLVWMR